MQNIITVPAAQALSILAPLFGVVRFPENAVGRMPATMQLAVGSDSFRQQLFIQTLDGGHRVATGFELRTDQYLDILQRLALIHLNDTVDLIEFMRVVELFADNPFTGDFDEFLATMDLDPMCVTCPARAECFDKSDGQQADVAHEEQARFQREELPYIGLQEPVINPAEY